MLAFTFPGQGSQFSGMGKDLYENSPVAKDLFEKANALLGFPITNIMFGGADEELKQTKVTQPAIFLHSVIMAINLGDALKPDMVAGHSLGEFSALVANKTLSFEDALMLVKKRADAMQRAKSSEPAKYLPELAKTTGYKGVTGTISFDEKGDVKNGALTLYTFKGGKRDAIAVVR